MPCPRAKRDAMIFSETWPTFLQFPPHHAWWAPPFFNELEEGNKWSVYLMFDESLIICLTNLKNEWFIPWRVRQCLILWDQRRITWWVFRFRYFENNLKKTLGLSFFPNLVSQSRKSDKSIHGRNILVIVDNSIIFLWLFHAIQKRDNLPPYRKQFKYFNKSEENQDHSVNFSYLGSLKRS